MSREYLENSLPPTERELCGKMGVGDSLKLLLRRSRHLIEGLLEFHKILEFGVVALTAERRAEANLVVMRNCRKTMQEKTR